MGSLDRTCAFCNNTRSPTCAYFSCRACCVKHGCARHGGTPGERPWWSSYSAALLSLEQKRLAADRPRLELKLNNLESALAVAKTQSSTHQAQKKRQQSLNVLAHRLKGLPSDVQALIFSFIPFFNLARLSVEHKLFFSAFKFLFGQMVVLDAFELDEDDFHTLENANGSVLIKTLYVNVNTVTSFDLENVYAKKLVVHVHETPTLPPYPEDLTQFRREPLESELDEYEDAKQTYEKAEEDAIDSCIDTAEEGAREARDMLKSAGLEVDETVVDISVWGRNQDCLLEMVFKLHW